MIIENRRYKNAVTFNDLTCGAVFEFNNRVYLKLPNDILFKNKARINAIDLGNNRITQLPNSVVVTPLKAKLITEDI